MPSSVNRLFLIDSSFAKKSHLSRIQWFEELGQVKNNPGSSTIRAPLICSIRGFVAIPPCAEKPPDHLSAASTGWHGTTGANGFLPRACPTARPYPALPGAQQRRHS